VPEPPHRYLLRGLVRCPGCGAPMGGAPAGVWQGVRRGARYICTGFARGRGGPSVGCRRVVSAARVEPVVLAAAHRHLAALRARAERTEAGAGTRGCARAEAARRRWARAALRLVDGTLSRAAYEPTRDAARAQLPSPAGAGRDQAPEASGIAEWARLLETGSTDERREVLAELMESATPWRLAWATYEVDVAWKRPL
jgi:Recombinase zinc beta ribbon domain